MTRLEQAMKTANDRKLAAVGSGEGIAFADNEIQDRAVFGGFDIEYAELVSTSTQIAEFYSQNAHNLGLRPLFISAWCDGLLTGLLLASLPTKECGYKEPPCIYCQHGQRCPYK